MNGLVQSTQITDAVKVLHWRNSLDIHKLIIDKDEFSISLSSVGEGQVSSRKINLEKLARFLPAHLLTVLMSTDRDENLQYFLRGIRLLNTFCDLTSRHPKLEQILLDDMRVTAQMLDLVIFTMVALAGNGKERRSLDNESLIDATVVTSSLYLTHAFISSCNKDLVKVFLAHNKVDIFIDCAFGAVHNSVRSLREKLLYRQGDLPKRPGSIEGVNMHCHQTEASLQFLHSLCQHKQFRDRVAKNKELCGKGCALMLAHSVLSLAVTPEFVGATVAIASISRMKAKVLSILQHLFEAESVSFLDEVANAGNLHLAQTVVSEVLNLLRFGLSKASNARAPPDYPMGFVLLNAMRLADVLTDDSNFKSFFAEHLSMILSAIFCLTRGDFLSMLCSSDASTREDDVNLDYDLFTSTGFVLSVFLAVGTSAAPQFKLNLQNNLTMASYAHQRSSLFIKMIANLHCFVPHLCREEERNRFVNNFMIGLRKDPSSILVKMLPCTSFTPESHRGGGVSKNLCSLLSHAKSLIHSFVNEEDYLLLKVFSDQLLEKINSEFKESEEENDDEATEFGKERGKEGLNLNKEEASENFDVLERATKESDIEGSSGSDSSSNRGKNPVENGVRKLFEGSGSGEAKNETSHQRKKRKRSIMNDDQVRMMENALADDPFIQKSSDSIKLWANKLTNTGPEVISSSQLKNWLNNRKAKQARANKRTGQVRDNNSSGDSLGHGKQSEEGLLLKQGQDVILMDESGLEVGKGIVMRTEGEWFGLRLERKICVVDVTELGGFIDWKWCIPYGSDDFGRNFEEAKSRFGVMRVAWDIKMLRY